MDADPLFGQQNPFAKLLPLVLESWKAGLDYKQLKPSYEKLRKAREISPGIYRRTPKGMWSHEMALSHDEIICLSMLSYIFDGGHVAREMWLARNWLGLYVSGPNEKYNPALHRDKWWRIHKNKFWKEWDVEWLTPWRPEYRAIWKLAMGQKIGFWLNLPMRWNIILSKSWNMKRNRLLFLEFIKYDKAFLEKQTKRLGGKYRGRYGDDLLFWNLWSLQDER